MYSDWGASNFFWQHRVAFGVLFFAFVSIDLIATALRTQKPVGNTIVLVNGSIWLGELVIRRGSFALRLGLFAMLAAWAPMHIAPSIVSVVVAYLAVDFIYYWKHRFYHETRIGWALHTTHHSSRSITALAAIRLSWFEAALDYLFFLPLALLGFEPLLLFALIEANGAYQFWLHTEMVGRLRWLDPWLNTPHNHRRHHSLDVHQSASNYGSTLMIWDHLFGTYRAGESHRGPYGVEGIRESINPLYLQFAGLMRLRKRRDPASIPPSEDKPTAPH